MDYCTAPSPMEYLIVRWSTTKCNKQKARNWQAVSQSVGHKEPRKSNVKCITFSDTKEDVNEIRSWSAIENRIEGVGSSAQGWIKEGQEGMGCQGMSWGILWSNIDLLSDFMAYCSSYCPGIDIKHSLQSSLWYSLQKGT